MGFLGLCLLFAGIALIKEGAAIPERDAVLTVFINRTTGSVLPIGNFARFVRASVPSPVCNTAGGRR
ncbi:MAG: hypothetical protein LBG27_00490 [Spirochaetaceae bacterium]|jgi:hypothetical protein|nr:hypothetical protein [Spirochaetaceae bacterium]